MYLLKVQSGFEAGHRLPEYNGPCRRAHGHSYMVQVTWKHAGSLATGIAIDLIDLKRILRNVLAKYDHNSLNTTMTNVPTAENLGKVLFAELKELEHGNCLDQVAVEETRDTCVIYRED